LAVLKVQVYGEEKVIANLKTYERQKIQGIIDIVNQTGAAVNRGAKRRARVDTGRLQGSITMRAFEGGLIVEVGTNLHYAKYVEYGTGIYAAHPSIPGRKTPWMYKDRFGRWQFTRGARPRPFLIPAYKEEAPGFEKKIRVELARFKI
jgi:HK97 gp10 family phage protein